MDDNKKSTTIWLRPSVISRMDGWLEADNCQSRSEFVDKALRFYMGYSQAFRHDSRRAGSSGHLYSSKDSI